jgi:hypothetical protein
MTEYFQLFCETHHETFRPLAATSPAELTAPDYETAAEEAGTNNMESLRRFHEEHRRCSLTTVKLGLDAPHAENLPPLETGGLS